MLLPEKNQNEILQVYSLQFTVYSLQVALTYFIPMFCEMVHIYFIQILSKVVGDNELYKHNSTGYLTTLQGILQLYRVSYNSTGFITTLQGILQLYRVSYNSTGLLQLYRVFYNSTGFPN